MPKKLPTEILALPNPDKEFHEKWTKSRDKLNIPHPFRAVALGPPNCGKGCATKNLIVRADPPFEEIIVIHCDPDFTQEWEDVDAEMMAEIPAPEEWKGEVKTLVILDDLEFKQMSKSQKRNLDRLMDTLARIKMCLWFYALKTPLMFRLLCADVAIYGLCGELPI